MLNTILKIRSAMVCAIILCIVACLTVILIRTMPVDKDLEERIELLEDRIDVLNKRDVERRKAMGTIIDTHVDMMDNQKLIFQIIRKAHGK